MRRKGTRIEREPLVVVDPWSKRAGRETIGHAMSRVERQRTAHV